MARRDVCGNEYERPMTIEAHGVEDEQARLFCCAHCARTIGVSTGLHV
jgi:hypothetical protein